MVSLWLGRVLELLFPTRCVSCGASGKLLCESCLARLKSLDKLYCVVCGKPAVGGFTHPGCATRYTPERVLSAFWYRGPAKKAIKTLKYKRVWTLAKLLSQLLVEDLEEKGVSFGVEAVIIPVPLAFWRRGKRGFNQAELLAKTLGERLNLSVKTNLLERAKETPSQTGLTRKERAKNVKGAFKVQRELRREDLLLVDDILTTGETVRECARILKKAGAGQVWVLTFAKD